MSEDVPLELRTFIAEHIGSIAQLELLILLASDTKKLWTAEEAAKALYTAADMTYGLLEAMRVRGLLEADGGSERYRFAPKNPAWETLVRNLDRLYKERRLTVINLIYAGPVEKLQSFANAFRFRRGK